MKKSGDLGEIIAIKYLKEKGYTILETNFKFSTIGEIDIITKLGELYVFFEVKYRFNDKYGVGEESINRNKKFKIKKTINYYCLKNKIDLDYARFDVIAILGDKINHHENVEL
ncbi:YraN family protein [Candidatus Gracilibacteria bacterium]|nr:YraN family protein [Candidatus Gracilibacteria bacterium]